MQLTVAVDTSRSDWTPAIRVMVRISEPHAFMQRDSMLPCECELGSDWGDLGGSFMPVTEDMRDPVTPASVQVMASAPEPIWDPTLGIRGPMLQAGAPKNRLVTIGDSLTQGFQSGAIFNTRLSYPMIIAWEMGWDGQLRYPTYNGFGGLPFNIEYIVRRLEERFGSETKWWGVPLAYFDLRHLLAEIEDWWERGPGSNIPSTVGIKHNLAVWGWDLRDTFVRTYAIENALIAKPQDSFFLPMVSNANERTALRVLDTAQDAAGNYLTPLQAAKALGEQGGIDDPKSDGIETLIVMLGANNALGTVVQLRVNWSTDPDYKDLTKKSAFTIWDPVHFAAEFQIVVEEVKKIRARHVIWCTVPHVTIVPIAHGVGSSKVRPGSRYFPYYTRPWISDGGFDPSDDPYITAAQARAIDSAIDQYNQQIVGAIRAARSGDGGNPARDWYVLDIAGILDRLASRRYIEDPQARPAWWTQYELPHALQQLKPVPDSRFFVSEPEGRVAGGLFALDGIHPTTIAYGIVAQEFINIMQRAGVQFFMGDGKTQRRGPIQVDFDRLISDDSLISNPPTSIGSDLSVIGWLDERFECLKNLFGKKG